MWPFRKKEDKPQEKRTRHHYVFAHVALRQVALADPYGFFAVMASPQRQAFLEDLWQQVCERHDVEGTASFTSSDIHVQTTQIGNYPTVLVEMPEPRFVAEAHMVCIVLKVPLQTPPPDDPDVRYFTLEKGRSIRTGEDKTVLGAWDVGSHTNFGDGPEATPAAFLERVRDLI